MRLSAFGILLLLVGACGTEGEPVSETTTTTEQPTTTEESTTTTESSTSVSLPESFPAPLLEEIVADAAQLTDVSESGVEVISVEAMTFDDAALGCPEPGQMYAQVLTPGFIVRLDAGGDELDYRLAEGSDSFRLCEQSS